jgi:hypothetical protein
VKTQCWLWPDHPIGKRESRELREEHNGVAMPLIRLFLMLLVSLVCWAMIGLTLWAWLG